MALDKRDRETVELVGELNMGAMTGRREDV
jgi:hypothetical protein